METRIQRKGAKVQRRRALAGIIASLLLCVFTLTVIVRAADEPPTEWIDASTGHRVIRLSSTPGSSSLYFHQNSYTPEGDKLIFDAREGIAAVDIATLGTKSAKPEVIVPGGRAIEMAGRMREVYHRKDGAIWATNVDTKVTREVTKARGGEINADETFIVNVVNETDPTGKTPRPEPRTLLPQRERMFGDKLKLGLALTPEEETSARKEDGLARRLANPTSQAFFFTNIRTGESKTVGYQYAWLNHLQFSPTDPSLLMYCHEGTWHEVDRIWTIRDDGSAQRLMHKRAMDMEIAGHEFWSHDGKTIWYDLQTPRSKGFWLAGVNVETGRRVRYKLERDQWSVHFNVSRDDRLFAGDGGDPGQVAFAKDGQWIYLYRPLPDSTLQWERLVNMAKHNYRLEPNITITPDSKWVVFRSNMHGATHVYAAEVAKATASAPATKPDEQRPPTQGRAPTLFIVGDSTVKNGTRGQMGWGEQIAKFFDKTKVNVENHAIGGRSSRTFQTEGRWDRILEAAKPGDFVIVQMGHNDGGPINDDFRARGSVRGIGEETQEIDNLLTKKHEIVHTYGWYLRKYVSDARAKGLTPIICSPIPHCPQKPVAADAVEPSNYVMWSQEVAKNEKALFIHLNKLIMSRYVGVDPADLKSKFFTPADNTHTSSAGADLNAAAVVEGIRALKECALAKYLLEKSE